MAPPRRRVLQVSALALASGLTGCIDRIMVGTDNATSTATPVSTPEQGTTKLQPAHLEDGDRFGHSVALDGDKLLVGAKDVDTDDRRSAGAAYVYERVDGDWTHQAVLTAANGDEGDELGEQVLLDGSTAFCSGYDATVDGVFKAGAVYVFKRVAGEWRQQAKLTAPKLSERARFGGRLMFVDGSLFVSAPGEASKNGEDAGVVYVVERAGGEWTVEATLLLEDGDTYRSFGQAMASDGEQILISASPNSDHPTTGSAGFIFEQTGDTWVQQATLTPPSEADHASFGGPVAIAGDIVLIGANLDDANGGDAGSVHVFERDGGTWAWKTRLMASDGALNDAFGWSIALQESTAVCGSITREHGETYVGSVYTFERSGEGWHELEKTVPHDGFQGDHFGNAVALDTETLVVGAEYHGQEGKETGGVYVYRREQGGCLEA